MAGRPRSTSVEQPLWRALTAYRVLTCGYAALRCGLDYAEYAHPAVAVSYVAGLVVWTVATLPQVSAASRCGRRFLVVDLTVALSGIFLTDLVNTAERLDEGAPTLPSIWTAGAVLAYAITGGWRWAAVAATLVGIANVVQRGMVTADTFHNVLLLWVASVGIGYVVEVARASERTLARALQIEAATRERERLARDIHDSVLQVLAMVQRRGTALGGEAAELGRLAGEQEVALRTLVSSGAVPAQRDRKRGRASRSAATAVPASTRTASTAEAASAAYRDLRSVLACYAGPRVTLVDPGTPVLLEPPAAAELSAAVKAALDNVRQHAQRSDGRATQVWLVLEDEPDAVLVTVRDDGPGIPPGRLADAEREGRMGVALSIRGRLRELGGSAELVSVPGQGTEVELRVPRKARKRAEGSGA